MAAGRAWTQNGWIDRRDERFSVLIPAKMRAGGFPVDVCIRNVSLRGVCAVTAAPPPRGAVVELTGPSVPIVGQVIWSSERRFGIKVGGRIDVPRLLSQRPNDPAPHELVPLPAYARVTLPAPRSAEDNRRTGYAMQFVIIAIAGAIAAAGLGQIAYDSLATASDKIAAGLTSR